MRNYLLLFIIFIFVGCSESEPLYYNGDFLSVYKTAQKKNKKLWMMLGGGENCKSCNDLFLKMEEAGTFSKFKKEYVFFKCNVIDSANTFLQQLFLMERVPNSYIFDEKGKLLFTSFRSDTPQEVESALIYVNRGNVYHCSQSQFQVGTVEELLKMHNFTLKASIDYAEGKTPLSLIDSSISICPYFYNLYLKKKIADRLGNKNMSDSLCHLTKEYYRTGYQAIIYKDLFAELNKNSKNDTAQVNQPVLQLDSSKITLPPFKKETENSFEIAFTNQGNKPLILFYISTQCSCIKAEFSKKPLNPKEKSTIKINYSANTKGTFFHTLCIQSNASNHLTYLNLSGNVI